MEAWNSIQNTIQYIENNLTEKINIEELAGVAYLSPFYFQRLFNRLVGKPVMEYVKLRRLAGAADYLNGNKDSRISETAYLFGFENHETFTRAFKAVYGMTPENYRANPRPLTHFIMPDISLNYYMVDENVPLISDGITLEVSRFYLSKSRSFIGYSIQNPMGDEPGVDLLGELWDKFHEHKASIQGLKRNGQEAGVSSPGEKQGFFTYFTGGEVEEGEFTEDFIQWDMPAGNYIICTFEAENFQLLVNEALNKARDYLFGVWLPKHTINTEYFMAELYYDITPEATKMELWVKIKEEGSC